jgi:hypothetical protein
VTPVFYLYMDSLQKRLRRLRTVKVEPALEAGGSD